LGIANPTVQIADNTGAMILPDGITGLSSTSTLTVDLTSFGTLTGTWTITCVG